MKLLVCPPVTLAPNFPGWPENAYSAWEESICPDCGGKVWLGERGKKAIAEGQVLVTCAACAVSKHRALSSTAFSHSDVTSERGLRNLAR